MDYTHLGRSGVSVSRLCLGTMNFGASTGPEESHQIMSSALERGINFFDTSNSYGQPRASGVTEQGHRQLAGRRKRAAGPDRAGDQAVRRQGRMAERQVPVGSEHPPFLRGLAAAARHRPYRPVPDAPRGPGHRVGGDLGGDAGAALPGKDHLRRLVELRRLAYRPGAGGRRPPACARSPLHGGLLGGILRKEQGGRSAGGRAAEALAEAGSGVRAQIEAYESFCDQLGSDPANVALAWLLHQPAVTAPIIGPRTAGQLDGALRALEVTLDAASLGRLDEIFPGPGGAAPEAYAW